MRKAIFDLIDASRAPLPSGGRRRYSQGEVNAIDALLDTLSVPRDGGSRSLSDPEAFFAGVRASTGPLDETQVLVINAMLASAAHWPISWLAYGLATAWHEARLRPIEEIGKGKGRKYGAAGKHGGQVGYGRGLVQLTWDYNYAKADDELGLSGALIRDYSLALKADIAVAILVRGMEEGWFTGKKLATYLPDGRGDHRQFVLARYIVNGTDKAALIAGYALKFQDALSAGGWS